MNQLINTELTLVCVANRPVTADVNIMTFESKSSSSIAFKPGQYITLKIPIDDEIHCRCYTLSSNPNQGNTLELIVKRVTEGVVSNWLLDTMTVGHCLQAIHPSGQFYLTGEHRSKILLISAGVGITPMLSMLRHIVYQQLNIDVIFHHSARSYADLICATELENYAIRHPNIRLSYNLTRETPLPNALIDTYPRRIDATMLKNVYRDLDQRDVFVCGPSVFMQQVNTLLLSQGLPAQQYFQESFEISDVPAINIQATKRYQIEFCHSKCEVVIEAGQTVLAAAEEAGIYIDTSCSSGICGSCSSYLIMGEVQAPQAQAIDECSAQAGEFLPCCSYAMSDLKIDL